MSSELVKFNDTRPYAPAGNLMFHKVHVRIGDSTVLFVCSEYQIKEGMTTLYSVRQKKEYTSNEKIDTRIQLCTTYSHSRGSFDYDRTTFSTTEVYTNTKQNYEFSVMGYEEIPCRSLAGGQIISIDSFPMCDENDRSWYTKDKIDSIAESKQKILDHNDRIVDLNHREFTKDHVQSQYDSCVRNLTDKAKDKVNATYRDEMRDYDSEIKRIDEEWNKKSLFAKWFGKKEEYPTEPVKGEVEISYNFIRSLRHSVKTEIDKFDIDVDLTYFDEIFKDA